MLLNPSSEVNELNQQRIQQKLQHTLTLEKFRYLYKNKHSKRIRYSVIILK